MNYRKLVWGIIFIFFGVLLMLRNLDIIYFHWYDIWQLWPMVLILWGVGMLPIKDSVKISITAAILLTGLWIFVDFEETSINSRSYSWHKEWRSDKDDYYEEDHSQHETTLQEVYADYEGSIDRAILHLNAAAGDFDLDGITTDNYMKLRKKGNIGDYKIEAFDIEDGKKFNVSLIEDSFVVNNVRNNIEKCQEDLECQ